MKVGKLLDRLNDILDDDRREQLKEIDSLKTSLKRLKKKQKEYVGKLEKSLDISEREKMQGKIDIIQAQRKKGIRLLRSLKKDRKQGKS